MEGFPRGYLRPRDSQRKGRQRALGFSRVLAYPRTRNSVKAVISRLTRSPVLVLSVHVGRDPALERLHF